MTRIRPWHVVLSVSVIYVAITLVRSNFDPKFLALIGPLYDPGVPDGKPGYDGQFAYQIARDPLNGWTKVDVPAYRYQRIVYPMAAQLLALGNVDLVPWMLIVINIAALSVGTWFIENLLSHFGASRWYALTYGLNAGTLMSVRLDLTEPLAYGLALAGVWLVLKGRGRWAAIVFAVAALTKETTLVFAASVGVIYITRREWRRAIELSVVTLLPFAIWQIVLRGWLGQWGVGSGGALATPFEIVPLRGLWSIALVNPPLFLLLSALMMPMAVIPALFGLWQAGRDIVKHHIDLPAMLLLVNAIVVLITPQSTFREPLAMARYVVGLVAAALIYAAARRSTRALNYTLLWLFTLALALNESQLPI